MGLLAGLLEVSPWVRQWHNDLDAAYGTSPADAYDTYLTAQRESRNLTEESHFTWLPPNPTRGRRK
jgi:hypothetical protein